MIESVLVVGGGGFIGSHVCDELLAHGYKVGALDGLSAQVHGTGCKWPVYLDNRVSLIPEFTMNEAATWQALDRIDAVIHLGALVGVGQSMYDIADYTYFNVHGTAVLLEKMIEHRPRKLIVASSMSIYGEGCYCSSEQGDYPLPTDEDQRVDLQSVYALTKYDQERLCLLFGRAYHVPTIALRLFNVYGPRQSLNNPYTGVMAIFASRLLNNHPPIIFEDGQQRRDFVSVHDIARAFRLALESDVSDEVINIGSGHCYTILELANKLNTVLGKDIAPEITHQRRTGDIRHCFADISKARQLLGYEPQIDIDEGIRELVEWLQSQQAIDRFDEHRSELVEKGLLR